MIASRVPAAAKRYPLQGWAGLAGVGALLLLCLFVSLMWGARTLSLEDIWRGLWLHDAQDSAAFIVQSRLPRAALAVLTGAALACAGTLMQALTRNPLADPGLLGINAGAAASVVAVAALTGTLPAQPFWVALPGSMLAALLVCLIGGQGWGRGADATRLVLAGAAVNATLFACVQGIALLHEHIFEVYRFWAIGSLGGQTPDTVARTLPYILGALVLALALSPALNLLMLGEELAQALGLRTGIYQALALLAVAVLSAAATAAVGPIAFVGLAVPHIVRRITGNDLRWRLAFCLLLGPVLMLAADIVARTVLAPAEVLTGVIVALIGAPFLLTAVRRPSSYMTLRSS